MSHQPLILISDKEYELQQSISDLIKNNLIQSAHDVADGGLFITLLESCMTKDLGFSIESIQMILERMLFCLVKPLLELLFLLVIIRRVILKNL